MGDSSLEDGEIDLSQDDINLPMLESISKKIKTSKTQFKDIQQHMPSKSKNRGRKHDPCSFEKNLDRGVFDNLQISEPQNCQMCKKIKYKYKCPACDKQTCSLVCCNKHKQIYKCSGKRNPTKMVQLEQYDSSNAIRDYNFLRVIIRDTEIVHKRLVGSTALPDALRYKLLKSNARRILEVDLRLAPKIMKKHRDNISFYSVKEKVVYWCVELKLYLGIINNQPQYHSHIVDPISQQCTFEQIIEQSEMFSTDILTHYGINLQEDLLRKQIESNQTFIYYPHEKVVAFLDQDEYQFKNLKSKKRIPSYRQNDDTHQQDLHTGKNKTVFMRIDKTQQLANLIRGSTVYEFPTFLMVPLMFLDSFQATNKLQE